MSLIKLFYATKTTGVDHRKHSIIQLAGMIEKDEIVVDRFNYLIKPHPKALIDKEALNVNKKTIGEIMQYPDMEVVLKQFKLKLGEYVNRFDKRDKMMLVGFNNNAFDNYFLRKMFELCGDQFFNSWFYGNTLDVSVLASQYLLDRRPGMPSFKLKRVALELGLNVDEDKMHDALYDVEITREVYRIVTGIEVEI